MTTVKIQFGRSMIGETLTKVSLYKGDMFKKLADEVKLGKLVCIHNFANNDIPGMFHVDTNGNHYFVTNTQEEQLLKMTMVNGKVFLPLDMYPIGEHSCLYSTGVKFNLTFTADVVTAAALFRPETVEDSYAWTYDEQITLEKMILVLYASRNVDVFITGLWGCGAFCHPMRAVLRLWKKAMTQVKAMAKEIVFCYYIDIFTLIPEGWSDDEFKILLGD